MPTTDFRIRSLTFSGGQTVPLESGTLLLLVGPNNSGKSAALREIGTWPAPQHERRAPVVLTSIEFTNVEPGPLLEFLRPMYSVSPLPGDRFRVQISNGRVWEISKHHPSQELLQMFYTTLIQRLDTEARLTYANPVARIDVYEAAPQAGIHWLQRDEPAYQKVNEVVRAAFGGNLVINWGGGSSVGFHFGDPPSVTAEHDRVSPKYLAELNRLPRLEQLGDGIRSFAATAIAARVGSHPIFLIDEPEAFLHPPQAARLGQVLGSLIAQQRRQAVVATHSADFVRGALLGSTEVAICRLERKGELNNASLLDADQVRQLWSSPLLRSSQAITGMFHEGVVVCEADADARFYEGILASVENRFSRPVDLYFVHGGGKGALASLARAYRQLEIPTVVIADLDLLKNEPEYFAVYAALGGTFADIQALYRSTASALAKSRPPLLPKTDPARL